MHGGFAETGICGVSVGTEDLNFFFGSTSLFTLYFDDVSFLEFSTHEVIVAFHAVITLKIENFIGVGLGRWGLSNFGGVGHKRRVFI